DYAPGTWQLPSAFVDQGALNRLPRHGIARSCKVGKEEVVGLLTALRLYIQEGDQGRRDRLHAMAESLRTALSDQAGLTARIVSARESPGMPAVEISIDSGAASAAAVLDRLRKGSPRIEVNPSRCDEGFLIAALGCLGEGDAERIAIRLAAILQSE